MTTRGLPRPAVAILAVAMVAFVVCALFGPGGLLTTWHAADVSYYGQLGAKLRGGAIPYRNLYVEYPPGALPVFLAPAVSEAHYVELFKVLMTIFGCALLAAVAACASSLGASARHYAVALAPTAIAPVLLGSVVLNRFDLWPTLLVAIGLAALLSARWSGGSAALALSVVTKIFAAAALPVVVVYLLRNARRTFRRATVVFVAICAVAILPFAAAGPGGLAFSFYVQLTRHLEIESLAGSIFLAADRLGLYHAHIVNGTPGSRDLAGTVPTALGVATAVLEVGALLAVAVWFLRGPATRARFVAAFSAALVGYVAFGKVLSPQYVIWLLPLVPLVRGRLGYLATALFAAALLLTRIEFSSWDSINALGQAVWVLFARNVTLVALFTTLAAEVRRTRAAVAT